MSSKLNKTKNKRDRQSAAGQNSSIKKGLYWTFWLVIVVLVIYAVIPSGSNKSGNSNSDNILTEGWVRGNPDASVILIEYSDFQCPACRSYYPVIEELVQELGEEFKFIYKHYPLTQIHPLAIRAGQATEAAGIQGDFWGMHDLIFERQNSWTRSDDVEQTFADYAVEIGIDRDKFLNSFNDSETRQRVLDNRREAVKLGLSGTPSFFLQGERIDNPGSLEEFRNLIQVAISNAPAPVSKVKEDVHTHADLVMYIEGVKIDLTQDKYQSTDDKHLHEYLHLHDGVGHVIHKHANGVIMGDFFESLGMNLSDKCLVLDSGEEYCDGEVNSLRTYVNGEVQTDLQSYEFQDLDRILVSFGVLSPTITKSQTDSVSDDACIYSKKCPERGSPPTESCVGGLGTECDSDEYGHEDGDSHGDK